jgi:RimJ/RimL family protein N-acetyltransferase
VTGAPPIEAVVLIGRFVRLEPLALAHVPALDAAASEDRSSFDWTPVPDGEAAHRRYVEQMISEHAAGRRLGFATVRIAGDRPESDRPENDRVVGTTSYLDPQRWPGGGGRLDSIEIGSTWIGASAQRTVVNSEAKLLMLAHAFDVMDVHRVVLNTDARNERSRAAIARIGATFEGVLHGFRYGVEGTPRDTATFAIRASEWPEVRARLEARVNAKQ